MPVAKVVIAFNLLLTKTCCQGNFNFLSYRNRSNSADTHQRVLLQADIFVPSVGMVRNNNAFFYGNVSFSVMLLIYCIL
jgi:hypothetical protein